VAGVTPKQERRSGWPKFTSISRTSTRALLWETFLYMTTEDVAYLAQKPRRLWYASTFAGVTDLTVAPPPACVRAMNNLAAYDSLDGEESTACAPFFNQVCDELENGVGFVVIDLQSWEGESAIDQRTLFLLLGTMLGQPIAQDVHGTLIYDVTDKGADVTRGARFSITNLASSFHTDNAYGRMAPDYVGLYSRQIALVGGDTQLVSGYSIARALRLSYPDVYRALQNEYYFDRRGEFTSTEEAVSKFPIIQWYQQELVFRYLRYYIEAGHEKASRPLCDVQRNAIDILDTLLQSRHYRAELKLKPSQALFVNNRWVLHNRTSFLDDPSHSGSKRHYLRLWLKSKTVTSTIT
jgi:alpha-ketoglutarate-dependent taurine dioxygenase